MAGIKSGLGALFGNKKKYEDALDKAEVKRPQKKVAAVKPKEPVVVKPVEPPKVGLGKPNPNPNETYEQYKARQKK